MSESRPELAELCIADAPERWQALGFALEGDRITIGEVTIQLAAEGHGITSWALHNLSDPAPDLDGLTTVPTTFPPLDEARPRGRHPNGAIGVDHVVVFTPDFDRTAQALADAHMRLRRIRDLGSFRQGFRRLGPAILELVEQRDAQAGPAHFWGLVVIVEDLDKLAVRLGDDLAPIRPAVQSGRQIATLRDSAGLSTKLAFMDPEPSRSRGARSALRFAPAQIDAGPGAILARAMRDEIAAVYEGLKLDGERMPKAGAAELSPPHGAFIVGWRDEEPICCGGVKRLPDGACEIKRMYVVPAARGRGVARALLHALEAQARALGYAMARLDTGPKQPHARALYESEGYVEVANFNGNPVATFFGEKRLD